MAVSVVDAVLDGVPTEAVAGAVVAALAPSALAFRRALDDPERAQRGALGGVLRAVAGSARGRRLGLARVRTARELQDAAPLASYEDLAVDVDATARGARGVLVDEPVVRFERSGGSSGARKLVPMTRSSLAEMQRALAPWLFDLHTKRPALLRGSAYWSISPLASSERRTAGGIPIGAEDDASWFPAPLQRLLTKVFAVPSSVAHLPDVDACRYATLRALLARPDLALISAWSPTFLSLLVQALDRDVDALIDDVARGGCRAAPALAFAADPRRADALRAARVDGRLDLRAVWPRLSLISVWTDGASRRFLDDAVARFPGVAVQGKGLLATEGVVTLPLVGAPAPVLAVRSHFYEFVPVEDGVATEGRPLLAHELDVGRTYEVVLSTSAGLLRYRLGDRVVVVGRHRATPCLRFVGRGDAVSDLVGEKVSAARVADILDALFAGRPTTPARAEELGAEAALRDGRPRTGSAPAFVLLAPVVGAPPRYRLYVEAGLSDDDLRAIAARCEDALAASHPYRYARALGQLAPVDVARVVDGVARYEAACVARGRRAGDVKPPTLERDGDWDALLDARVVAPAREDAA